jgi:hypothetical protein
MAVVINKRSLMVHSLSWCWPKSVILTLAGNALFQIAGAISSWRVELAIEVAGLATSYDFGNENELQVLV